MVTVAVSTTIDRPVREVFDYVSDVSNEPSWHTDMLEARQSTPGPIGVGTRYDVRMRPFMGMSEAIVEVVDYAPDRVQFRGAFGPLRSTITHRVEPARGGTRLTRRVQVDASGVMRLIMPIMAIMIRRSNTVFLASLKRLLEQEPGPTSPAAR